MQIKIPQTKFKKPMLYWFFFVAFFQSFAFAIPNGNTVTNTYDILQRRTAITSSLGADIALELDELDNITKMNANGWNAAFKYDRLGLEVERNMLAGINSYTQRDKLGRIKSHRVAVGHSQTAPTKLFRQYDWDVNDRLTQIIHNGKTATTFEHDQWGNLSKTTFGDGEIQLRNPDKVGNLFESKDRKDKKYDKAGRLIESKTASYKYNLDGFLIEKKLKNGDIWKYFWSAAGTLEKVIRPDKQEVVYKYDALGRRIWKKISKTTTKWLWDGNKVLHEYKEFAFRESTADDLITWIFEEDSFTPCAKIKGEKKYSIIADHIGTPVQGYNEEGSLIWERELDSYGKTRMQTGDEGFTYFTYQGQVYDKDIDLTYNYHRWYDQSEGIYCSQDPIRLDGSYYNLYAYVHDPNNWVDIFGLDIGDNQSAGAAREKLRAKELQQKYPDAQVQRESYLRDFKGKRIKDEGFTGEARRVDMVVIKDGKIVHIEEVTSKTARKGPQEKKTDRIRGKGPVYVKDRKTGKLILLPKRKKISCYRMD